MLDMGVTTLLYSHVIFQNPKMVIRCDLKSASLLLKPKVCKITVKSGLVYHKIYIDIRYLT